MVTEMRTFEPLPRSVPTIGSALRCVHDEQPGENKFRRWHYVGQVQLRNRARFEWARGPLAD